jgi:hypothetical protein
VRVALTLLVFESLALHDFMDEGTEAVMGRPQAADTILNFKAVRAARGRAGGVSEEFECEVAGKLVGVGEYDFLERIDVSKRLRLRCFSAWINGRPLAVEAGALKDAVVVAPAADGVVAFERKAGRVHLCVTA